jgi:hypothetical protein
VQPSALGREYELEPESNRCCFLFLTGEGSSLGRFRFLLMIVSKERFWMDLEMNGNREHRGSHSTFLSSNCPSSFRKERSDCSGSSTFLTSAAHNPRRSILPSCFARPKA